MMGLNNRQMAGVALISLAVVLVHSYVTAPKPAGA